MRKLFALVVILLSFSANVKSQFYGNAEFPITVNSGMTDQLLIGQYYWDSPQYSFNEPVEGIRITFKETNGRSMHNGYPLVAISELLFYSNSYFPITLTAANLKTNSLEGSEGSLAELCDGDFGTYYHSAWKDAIADNDDYVYVEVKFPEPLSVFQITMVSRNRDNVPTSIVITEMGVKYDSTIDTDTPTGGGDEGFTYIPVDVTKDSVCFVYLANGGVDAYQKVFMDGDSYMHDNALCIPLKDGETVMYDEAEFDSCSWVSPALPEMTSFKFNNKYNANLNVDVEADSVTDEMTFKMNAIGKSLTASFKLSDDRAVAFVDTVLQISKESRVRFDKPVYYVVTYPGYNVVQSVKVSDEIWDYGETIIEEIPLRADMLYTNKPSEVGDDLSNMLDNNPSTVFHTVYGKNYDASVIPYFTITLDEAVDNIKFYYMARNTGNYNPMELVFYVSEDGEEWELVRNFTAAADGLPLETGAEYTSPEMEFGKKYRYFKIEQLQSEYKNNHMVFAEFRLYTVEEGSGEPTKVQDAVYETHKVPFGRVYTVNTIWLTDNGATPRIDIDIENGKSVTSKDVYLKAQIRITGYGVYDDFVDSVNVKGRGNSTWSYPKKPYRLKFEESCKPFGLTKGKNWVLLANYQRGSMMANAIAMKVGQLAQVPFTNHIIPVDLYMNGSYMGSYMFTEHVRFGNNSVDINEDLDGYMLELDSYYDEDYRFKSENYNLPVNIKEPGLSDMEADEANSMYYMIQGDFNRFESAVYNGTKLSGMLDVDVAARFMLTNDIVLNQELGHPKSTFLWREDMASSQSKIMMGPLWDFDWGFGYESGSNYCYNGATSSLLKSGMSSSPGYKFFKALMGNEEFKKYYYKVWKEFIDKRHITEVVEFLDDYYDFAKSSFENNYYLWYDRITEQDIDRMQKWMQERHDFIAANIDEYDISELLHTLPGDVDCSDNLTVRDITLAVSYMFGNVNQGFNMVKADMDNNKKIDAADVENIASQVAAADAISSIYYFNTPLGDALLSADDFEVELESTVKLPVAMEEYGSEGYKALQMDVKMPAGVVLVDAVAGERAAGHTLLFNQTGEEDYRIVIYSAEDESLSAGEVLTELSLYSTEVIPEDERNILISNVLAVGSNDDEVRLDDVNVAFGISAGISETAATVGVRGGSCLTITALAAQDVEVYSVDGRLVRRVRAAEGTTTVQLPAGIYVVLGNKVIIH